MDTIGERIRYYRRRKGWKQQDLAEALGYKTYATIYKVEAGLNQVTPKKLQRYAEVLDTTVDELLGVGKTYTEPSTPLMDEVMAMMRELSLRQQIALAAYAQQLLDASKSAET